jgi:hypothetical protein
LEQAWAINHDALSHVTSWCDGRRLGWIELWLMANLIGPAVGGHSAGAQGVILMLALSSAALLYLLAKGPRATHEKLVIYPSCWLPSASARGPSGGPASGRLTA